MDETKDSQEKTNSDEKKEGATKAKKKKPQFKTTDLPIEFCVPTLSNSDLQLLIEKEVMAVASRNVSEMININFQRKSVSQLRTPLRLSYFSFVI